jgi:cytochrome b561
MPGQDIGNTGNSLERGFIMIQSGYRWKYDPVTQWLHWLTAALVIVLLVMGKTLEVEADEPGNAVFLWHSSLGVLVFALAAVRIVWRVVAPAPPPEGMGRIALLISKGMHGSLYLLLFAVPVSGWLAGSAVNAAAPFFGLFSIPVSPVHVLGKDALEELHELLGNILLVLAALHLLAALKHHFLDRDTVLKRMLPGRGGPGTVPAGRR